MLDRRTTGVAILAVTMLVATLSTGCGDDGAEPGSMPSLRPTSDHTAPRPVPDGALADDVDAAVRRLASSPEQLPGGAVDAVAASGDLRGAWILVDLLRVAPDAERRVALADALAAMTEAVPPGGDGRTDGDWYLFADLLLAWDVPEPPGYPDLKRQVYATAGHADPVLAAAPPLDWRGVAWSGGDRPTAEALADPEMVTASDGGWLDDGELVVGVEVAGESRAVPLRVLQVHGLVTFAAGGRRVALAHSTSCGSTTGYLVDRLPGEWAPLELQASGFVDRGAPLLVDAAARVVVDALSGVVVPSGHDRAPFTLERAPLVVTTWGAWRSAQPDTAVVSRDAGTGRVYVPDPVGRPSVVPAVPTGPIDPTLDPAVVVLGAESADGVAVAFVADEAEESLGAGEAPSLAGVSVERRAGGLVATDAATGRRLASHPAYWFAWSAAHPASRVWTGR